MKNKEEKWSPNQQKGKWSSRFEGEMNKDMQLFQSSLPFDGRLYPEDIRGSIAHLKVLYEAKIITNEEKDTLTKGLKQIEIELGQSLQISDKEKKMGGKKFFFGYEEDDIHMWIEKRLGEIVGSTAAKLHTARSRNDQISTDLRLYTRNAIHKHLKHLTKLISAIHKKAQNHIHDLMPGHTHLQAAQPMTFSFYLLAYFFMLTRDIERLEDCQKRVNLSPLGSGAFCGVNYPIDRNISAKELDFDGILTNAMDAVADRDYLIEYHNCAATTMIHLSRMAEDFIIFSSLGFDFIEISDGFTTGSSIMPNKKNPDACELIRGKVGRTLGNLQAIYTILKGQPLAYNRDLQEDKEGLFDTEKTLDDCVNITCGMIETLTIKKENMLKALQKGYILATEIADYLVYKGVAFRKAHEITGTIVAKLAQEKKTFADMSLEDFKKHHDLFDKDVFIYLNPQNAIERKQSSGSTSVKSVKKQLEIAQKIVEKYMQKVAKISEK